MSAHLSFKKFIFVLLMLLVQPLSAQEKCKILRFSGSMNLNDLRNRVDSTVNKSNDLYILDFSKVICSEWQEDKGFYFNNENKCIQGVILPDSIKYFSYCDCPDLKFLQLSSYVTGFRDFPFCSETLRFVFITGDEKSVLPSFRYYNSAKIVHQDCFEYAKENKINLFRLNAACKEKDYDFYIPPEEVKVTTKVSFDSDVYTVFTTNENSDRRVFQLCGLNLRKRILDSLLRCVIITEL